MIARDIASSKNFIAPYNIIHKAITSSIFDAISYVIYLVFTAIKHRTLIPSDSDYVDRRIPINLGQNAPACEISADPVTLVVFT